MSPRRRRAQTTLYLLAAVLLVIGPEIRGLEGWSEATSTAFIGNVLLNLGGVLIAWMVKGPLGFGRTFNDRYERQPLRGPGED